MIHAAPYRAGLASVNYIAALDRGRAARQPRLQGNSCEHAHAHAQGAPVRMSWARLLKRVFEIDIEHYPHWPGGLKIIVAYEARDRTSPAESCDRTPS